MTSGGFALGQGKDDKAGKGRVRGGTRGHTFSQDYIEYQQAEQKEVRYIWFEKLCHKLGGLISLDFGKDFHESQSKYIRVSRLNVTPEQVAGTFTVGLVFLLLLTGPGVLLLEAPLNFFVLLIPIFYGYTIITYPKFRSQVVRIQSADAGLRVILYMAMYLDMNPNLEGALQVAASHTTGPLGEDLANLLWGLQVRRYTTVKHGLGTYMPLWREWSPDFVKSMEFLVNAVSRIGPDRRMMIKKSQDYIIESTYVKMQEFSRALRSPVNLIHMMGIVLPIMGLIMFPLISIFMSDEINASYLLVGYVVVLPAILAFMIYRQIVRRPGAFSHPSLDEVKNLPPKGYYQLKFNGEVYDIPLKPIAILLGFLIMIPGLMHFWVIGTKYLTYSQGSKLFADWMTGQYDPEALFKNIVLAMTVFWGLIVGLYTYFRLRSSQWMKVRNEIEEIEQGLEVGLTELENSLSKNIPIERAIVEVVEEYEKVGDRGTPMHRFFFEIRRRVDEFGMPVPAAMFDRKFGVVYYFPSALLRNVMRVVANSVPKGTRVLITNIRTITDYIKNSIRVEQLIRGMLDEVIGQMKTLAGFIAPVITSIAAVMSSLIIVILSRISVELGRIDQQTGVDVGSGLQEGILGKLADLSSVMPPTVTLIIIAIYLVELVILLSYFINGVEHGFDDINRDAMLAKYLLYAGIIFTLVVISGGSTFIAYGNTLSQGIGG